MASSCALISKSGRVYRGKHVEQEFNLSSFLWENLPQSLVEEILARLPFLSLMRMCRVQKRWRDLILSSRSSGMFPRCTSRRGRLLFYNERKLEVYSSVASRETRGRMWETMSLDLQFRQEFNCREVIASAAGLLCFHTWGERGIMQFIVYNPITKCYKSLQLLYHREASAINDQPCMPTSASPALCSHCFVFTSYLAAGMVVDSDTGHFKLIVLGIHPSSRGTTLVYDSSVDSWKKVAPVLNLEAIFLDNDYNLNQNLHGVQCGKSLYFYLKGGVISDRLLKYDVEHETWSSILLPTQMKVSQNVLEHNGKIVLVTSSYQICRTSEICSTTEMIEMIFQAWELQDEGPTLWLPINHPPFSTIREAAPNMRGIECLGQGDVVFLVRRNVASPSSWVPGGPGCCRREPFCTVVTNSVREFRRDLTNSYVDSGWEEYTGDQCFPLGHVFMPSTLLLK